MKFDEPIYTEKELCRLRGCARTTLYRERRQRKLGFDRVGLTVLYRESHLRAAGWPEEFLESWRRGKRGFLLAKEFAVLFLTQRQAAALLRIHPKTLYRWTRERPLRTWRAGRSRVMYLTEELIPLITWLTEKEKQEVLRLLPFRLDGSGEV